MLVDRPLRDLLTAFSSADPTPGGGSASALAAAVGASLLIMVASLPRSRSGSDDDRVALSAAVAALAEARQRLAEAIDADSAAYDHVVAALRQPKASGVEQAARKAAIQCALGGATDVPLNVMRWSVVALQRAEAVAAHGHRAAASDVGVAVGLLRAGFDGARLNVRANLEQVTDLVYKERVADEVDRLQKDARQAVEVADRLVGE